MEFLQPRMIPRWLKVVGPVFLGAVAGYAYYATIGCVSGACPITSNPWISTAYGGVLGALLVKKENYAGLWKQLRREKVDEAAGNQ